MHGTDLNQPSRPDWKTFSSFSSDSQIINVFGTTSGAITSIGFKTIQGTVIGPIGAGGGDAFSMDGLLLGFFGALQNNATSGIGVWYMPGNAAFPLSLEMSPAYGNLTSTWAWDDTPDMGGAHHLLSLPGVTG